MARYELTISTNYVPDWTYIEAVRELFQNALDNEAETPGNVMAVEYDGQSVLTIANKTSALEVSSLLLGVSTKRDSSNTIGKHGEGYKIAFMVLAREGKGIRVYNYGKRETWDVKMINSRRFGNEQIIVVDINKQFMWASVPSEDLTVEITGITPEEYMCLADKNLNLQDNKEGVKVRYNSSDNKILTDSSESGNIYVNGLYVCKDESFKYGYSFSPKNIKLDRDRRLVSTFNLAWEASGLWIEAFKNGELQNELAELIENKRVDAQYVASIGGYSYSSTISSIEKKIAARFVERHGERAVPVCNSEQLRLVNTLEERAVIVSEQMAKLLSHADKKFDLPEDARTLTEQFVEFFNSIEGKLTDEEREHFSELIDKI